ncbi:hypothetical protein [Gimesia sp.]|uniref:hypothetical protein n=1 Tax=Gimesia sp. TaxID=2024833 RepID=UPI000C6A2503|nr:hypothetical protein [Gimesia sp.]MAX35995.1 hypothetical protein [Gimesia sp.]HBL42586.1 hypothetical protein [Planctomycetaceae bacterium]|tara:strand:+ start:1258 stop:2148 length:891 start_codon:yes stop_codon:yes gene_type:complete
MDITTFQCPHCQAMLRMRNRQVEGSTFPCPDCGQQLRITSTPQGELSISHIEPEPKPTGPSPLVIKARTGWKQLQKAGTYLLASPVLMAWLVAGTGALILLLLILFDDRPSAQIADNQAAEPETVAADAESETTDTPADQTPMAQAVPELPADENQNQPEPEVPDQAVDVPFAHQVLIAAKPENLPPLIAPKPQPVAQPAMPQTDVTLALQIPILEFRQTDEIPLKTMMIQFEEMLDTRFELAENVKNDPRLLETPIALSRRNTTLSNLLEQILSEGALTFRVKSNKIYIERAAAP